MISYIMTPSQPTSSAAKSPPKTPRIAQVCCEFTFEASHILSRDDWSEAENDAVFGKCVRLHGHSYRLRVSYRGPVDEATGMVVNFFDVKRAVHEAVVERLDHRHLNEIVPFIPTAENLALWIARQLIGRLPGVTLSRVELWETRAAYAFLDEADLARL